jgi:hypothetical protein
LKALLEVFRPMNLDSVTVGHVITADFGPDRRSRWCKAWDWLRDHEAKFGVKHYSFPAAPDCSNCWDDDSALFAGTRERKNFEIVRRPLQTCLQWLSLLLTTALFIAIHVYAGGGA